MHEQAIQHYFADKEPMLVEAVSRLVRIDSTLGPALPGKPFGEGPAAALEELLALARSWGLSGQNLEGYVGTVDLNDQETVLHILGHLDVVDPGEGWTVTEAFVPKLVDGLLYGRGTDDDKGPVAAALLAMKAVKDLGIPLRRNVRLIAGTDEETGFRDVKWYYSRHPYAPYTISPDADFPIINIEKGHYQPTFQAAWPQEQALPRVSDFTGGTRLNMVPPKAQATVLGLSLDTVEAAIRDLALEEAISFSCQEKGPGVHILCSGQNAHGSTPEEGHNAQTALVALLASLMIGLFIRETLPAERRQPFHLRTTLGNFATLFRHKRVLSYMLASGFSFAGMFSFLSAGPFVYININHVAPQHFGYYFALNIVFLFLMTMFNSRFVRRVGALRMFRAGLWIQFAMAVWMVVCALLDVGFWSLVIGVAAFVGCVSMVSSNAMAVILDEFPHMAGTASSLAGTFRFGIGAIIGALLSMATFTTAWPMLISIAFCATCSIFFSLYASRRRKIAR